MADGRANALGAGTAEVVPRAASADVLRDSGALFTAILDATTDIVFVKDVEGRYLHINAMGCRVLGRTLAEVIGKCDHDLWPADLAACCREADRRILESGSAETTEESTVVGGRRVTYLTAKAPYRDAEGRMVGILAVARDISERKAVEEALRRSQERLREALQASKLGLWEWNTATDDVVLSREWQLQLGYEEAELPETYESWESRVHPDDLGRVRDYVKAYVANPVSDYQQEFRLRHKDGSYRWIWSRASLVTEPDGRRVRLLGSHTDVTERRQWEQEQQRLIEELTRSRQQFQTLFNWTPSAVGISTLPEGRFFDVNEGFARLTGYTREELIGRTTLEMGLWADPSERTVVLDEIRERGCLHNREGWLRTKSGAHRLLMVSVDTIQLGSAPCLIYLAHDITERKRIELLQTVEIRIFEAIARSQSLDEVLTLLVRTVEKVDEAVRCSILLLDHDGARLRVAAAPSLPDEFNRAADGLVIGPSAGSCGRAAHTKQTVVVADIEHDPLWDSGREHALRHGLRACWSVPICAGDGTVLGTFALYYSYAPRIPSPHEVQVVERMTHLAGFAVQRLRAEQALRESQADLRRITDAIPGFVYQYRVGPDGAQSFPFASRGTKDLLGCESWELEADASVGWRTVLPEDVQGLQASIEASAAGVTPWTHEFRVRSRDGAVKWLRGSSLPERQADGGIVWYGLFTDVTARRKAEQQLRFTQFAMDHAADAILLAGPDGRLVYVNQEACRSLGYRQDELLLLTMADVAPRHDPVPFAQRVAELKQGQGRHYESVHRAKNGREFPVEVSIRYLEHEGVGYTYAMARDIAERRLLEQRLRHADRLATLGTITAGVAHELNNPLFVISGHLHLIERNLARRQYKAIQTEVLAAQEASLRATQIVNQFLSTAHTSTGELDQCEVAAVSGKAIALLQNDLRSRRIVLETKFSPSVPPVLADPQGLIQVFLNLLTNARQAVQHLGGKGRIRVSVEAVETPEGTMVECRVQDNGPGILPEHSSRIFDPFFTTKPVGEGTGLGLAICHRIVNEASGTLTCRSVPGEGATFVVRLPAAKAGRPIRGRTA